MSKFVLLFKHFIYCSMLRLYQFLSSIQPIRIKFSLQFQERILVRKKFAVIYFPGSFLHSPTSFLTYSVPYGVQNFHLADSRYRHVCNFPTSFCRNVFFPHTSLCSVRFSGLRVPECELDAKGVLTHVCLSPIGPMSSFIQMGRSKKVIFGCDQLNFRGYKGKILF